MRLSYGQRWPSYAQMGKFAGHSVPVAGGDLLDARAPPRDEGSAAEAGCDARDDSRAVAERRWCVECVSAPPLFLDLDVRRTVTPMPPKPPKAWQRA